MAEAGSHFDVIIVGSGAGGATLAQTLADTGKKILILDRGDYLVRGPENWNSTYVFVDRGYRTKEIWYDRTGRPFHPNTHYWVGGNTTFYGAALFRLRPSDFEEVSHGERRRRLGAVEHAAVPRRRRGEQPCVRVGQILRVRAPSMRERLGAGDGPTESVTRHRERGEGERVVEHPALVGVALRHHAGGAIHHADDALAALLELRVAAWVGPRCEPRGEHEEDLALDEEASRTGVPECAAVEVGEMEVRGLSRAHFVEDAVDRDAVGLAVVGGRVEGKVRERKREERMVAEVPFGVDVADHVAASVAPFRELLLK